MIAHRRDKAQFCVTNGRDWMFVLLRKNPDNSGGWIAFRGLSHQVKGQISMKGSSIRDKVPVLLRLLVHWVSSEVNNHFLLLLIWTTNR